MSISGERSTTQEGKTTTEDIDVLDDTHEVGQLRATFEAATHFGLTDKEIWAIIMDVCNGAARDGDGGDPLDALSAALATRILEHERAAHSHY